MIGWRFKAALAAVGAFFAALAAAFFKGRKAAQDEQQTEELNEYVETRKRADKADRAAGDGDWHDRVQQHRNKR